MTKEVERAYYRAQKADDAFQAALDRTGESRYSYTPKSASVRAAKKRKIKADAAYHKALDKQRRTNGTGWIPAKAIKIVRDKNGNAAKLLIRKNPGESGGGAGSGAGAGSEGGYSSTDVKSPTRTSTSTEAETTGNITVTGGAGRGANTTVTIAKKGPGDPRGNPRGFPRQWVRAKAVKIIRNKAGQATSVKIKT